MDIQELKAKLQSLFDELKKEVDGRLTATGVFLPPTSGSYYLKAKALVDAVVNYSKLDNSIRLSDVLHTFNKEVSYVKDYEGKGKTAKKRQEELTTLMHKATRQLYIDLCPLVKND